MDKLQLYGMLDDLRQRYSEALNNGDESANSILDQIESLATTNGLDGREVANWAYRAGTGIYEQAIPGLGTPQATALNNYNNSELPTSGVSFDDFLKRTGASVDGGMMSNPTNSVDWLRGDNSGLLENAIKFGGLALTGYTLGTGLEGLISGAGSAGVGAVSDPFIQAYTPDLASSGMFSGAGSGLNTLEGMSGQTGVVNTGGDLLQQYGTQAADTGQQSLTQGLQGSNYLTNDQMIQNAASAATGGAETIPGLATSNATAGAAAGLGLPPALGTTAAAGGAAASGGLISQIARALGIPDSVVNGLTTSSPLSQGLGALASYFSGQDNARYLTNTLNDAAKTADPFGSQRSFYQDKLKQSYMDPNFFKNDPVFSGIRNTAMSDVERAAAARGYNNSTNVLNSIGSRINDEGLKYANLYQGQLGQLAGGGINPSTAAGLQSQGAQLGVQAGNKANANLGDAIASIPGIAKQFGLI